MSDFEFVNTNSLNGSGLSNGKAKSDQHFSNGQTLASQSTKSSQVVSNENNYRQDPYRIYCFSPVRSKPLGNSQLERNGNNISSPFHPGREPKGAKRTRSPAILMPTPSNSHSRNQRPPRDPYTDQRGLDSKRVIAEGNLFSPRIDPSGRNLLSPRIETYPSHSNSFIGTGGMGLSYLMGGPMFRPSSTSSSSTQHIAMKLLTNHSSAWNDRFNELLEYKKEHGDCLVPQRYPQNPQLGVWVNKQRAEYKLFKEGKKSSMTQERINALESVGFIWAKRRKGQPTWDLKFEELTAYRQEHGDCLVPTKYAENPALGRWVSTQRAQYKLMQEGKPSTTTAERVRLLENLGFVWRLQF